MALASVSIQHSTQGEVRADISVEHEERLRSPGQDLVPKMVEPTPCAEWRKFLQVPVPRDPSQLSEMPRARAPDTPSPDTSVLVRSTSGQACKETLY